MRINALSISNEKEAALYFDKIIQLNIIPLFAETENMYKMIINNLVPEDLDKTRSNNLYITKDTLIDAVSFERASNGGFNVEVIYDKICMTDKGIIWYEHLRKNKGIFLFGWVQYITEKYIYNNNSFALVGDNFKNKNGKNNCFSLTDLQVIDTSAISWEQILEIRKDKDLFKKLGNFRIFFENENKEKK